MPRTQTEVREGSGSDLSRSSSQDHDSRAQASPKLRGSRAGARSVNTLTAAQLERKRANDRESQRTIRQRTKDHIEALEKQVMELDAKTKQLDHALQQNSVLVGEISRLQRKFATTTATPEPSDTLGPLLPPIEIPDYQHTNDRVMMAAETYTSESSYGFSGSTKAHILPAPISTAVPNVTPSWTPFTPTTNSSCNSVASLGDVGGKEDASLSMSVCPSNHYFNAPGLHDQDHLASQYKSLDLVGYDPLYQLQYQQVAWIP